jgi:type IV secretion system protein VirD4
VRVSFATNDERTAKRVSDALGTATELRAMKNYAGHRLSPWLGHLMVSRQETARPLLTPGEVMQLPRDDELVLVSGVPPIRAKKARYFEDPRLTERVLPPPKAGPLDREGSPPTDDWSRLPAPANRSLSRQVPMSGAPPPVDDPANSDIRREPNLPRHEDIVAEASRPLPEFDFPEEDDGVAVPARVMRTNGSGLARQAAMDSDDGFEL